MQPEPHVWTCGAGLIGALAQRVLAGFPLDGKGPHDLSRWTILVPTRRAARTLETQLFKLSGSSALLLPRVRPIGDADEDLLADVFPDARVPEAVSSMGQLFLLLTLVGEWAAANPHLALAQDVQGSRSQALGLAQSLADLVSQMETEEVTASLGNAFEGLDLAEHRQTLLSLLHLVQDELPRRLHGLERSGPAERRNRLIRLEAQRIAADMSSGPVIAAGSTGTNPATRDLLKAIALHPQGAVILPGLDHGLDAGSWDAAGPNHPQHALKILLAHLGVNREQVRDLTPATPRQTLAREIMRPAETTERWSDPALLPAGTLAAARGGLRLVEAQDRHMEARSIALLLREVLETPERTAALVTPDRDLAQMVTAELARWSAAIDDSGGEPLIRFGRAQLCKLVIDCVEEDFSPAALVALLAHPAVTLGLENTRGLAQLFELVLLRQDLPPAGPEDFSATLASQRPLREKDRHAHRAIGAMDDAAWVALADFTARLAAALTPLAETAPGSLADHVARLTTCLDALAPAEDDDGTARAFADAMQALTAESAHHPDGTFRRSLVSIAWALRQDTLRPPQREGTRLAIFGLAEARMIDADLVVLSGLNETVWPAATDPGPWVNRAMRGKLGLAAPERDIGQTAHDFVQGLMHPSVAVTWSKRAGKAPLMPSRWILRLRALLEKCGVAADRHLDTALPLLARALDQPQASVTLAMPRPAPPVSLRPKRFSVTEIEKLIRDPYAIFARRILGLDAIEPLGGTADLSLRGLLVHDALHRYVAGREATLPALLAAGEAAFAPYMAHADVRHFWWPRFRRMAAAFVEEDISLRSGVAASLAECPGKVKFLLGGIEHLLHARADRIDITQQRTARFTDYKTGTVPSPGQVESGLSPQLTLEAAILRHGSFGEQLPADADDLIYIQTGGGRTPVKVTSLASGRKPLDIAATAQKHFEGLQRLLTRYLSPQQVYVPRAVMYKEDDVSDYDHLSRFAEWSRGGA
jgi:ATP-dependent helicase/nuclease subunit B